MFGYDRQVYYRSINRVNKKQERAEVVIALVKSVRNRMPRIGVKKLYHILEIELKKFGVDRKSVV